MYFSPWVGQQLKEKTIDLFKCSDPLISYIDPKTQQLREGLTQEGFYKSAQSVGLEMSVQVNGLNNSFLQAHSNGQSLAAESLLSGNPQLVVNVYNAQHNMLADVLESGLSMLFGLDSPSVVGTRLAVADAVEYNNKLGNLRKKDVYTNVWGP